MRDLFPQIRRAGVASVAKRLGLTVLDYPHPGSIAPCPGCTAPQRGAGDRRGPIGLHRDGLGWICHRCKLSGDACSLAALVITGNPKPDSDGWKQVRERFVGASLPTYQPPPRIERRPPLDEVLDLWSKSTRVYDSPELVPILEERCLDPGDITERDLCRVLHQGHLPSWATYSREPWNKTGHLCLFPFYNHRGELVSLHARRMEEGAPRPKGLSPLGYESAGLCFLDSLGRELFRNQLPDVRLLVLPEGPPDFLTASLSFGEENTSAAVCGVVSGSWTADWAARVPTQTHVQIATHEDQAGEFYAKRIAQTFSNDMHITRWRAPQ